MKIINIFYERLPEGVRSRRWHGVAYRDWMNLTSVMVIWPFHWVVQFFYWIGYCWDRHRHRPSWIDNMVEQAVKRSEESDARRYIRKHL